MKTRRHGSSRRIILGALALSLFAAPSAGSGCAAGFAPISKIDGLRVIGVVADKPYAQPGDTVTFTMVHEDSYTDPNDPDATRPLQILWLGGCFDPAGDEYYGCYPQLASLLQGFDPAHPPSGLISSGEIFTLTLPMDIVSRRPAPAAGAPYYGIAYVFFAACAGTLGIVPAEGTSEAGSFPIGCFDAQHHRLGADSFVPGYTQVYVFADGRTNANPVVDGLDIDGAPIADGPGGAALVERCDISDADRDAPPGCGRPNPAVECKQYQISVDVPADVAEVDPDSKGADGQQFHEAVWVDYYTDQGDFKSPTQLVSDAVTGFQKDHGSTWTAPSTPGLATLWAVVHDARGGETVIQRYLQVK